MSPHALTPAQRLSCLNEVLDAADAFCKHVLPQVVNDRLDTGPTALTENKQSKLSSGKSIDVRPVRLMAISGKGGHSSDAKQAAHFAQWSNISLLDHLASVARGAAVITALELGQHRASRGMEVDQGDELPLLVGLSMALGFLHDVNKCVDGGVRSNTQMSSAEVAAVAHRFGIEPFLVAQGWTGLNLASWETTLHHLVRGSEVNQTDEDMLVACEEMARIAQDLGVQVNSSSVEAVVLAVRAADRLDGAWLKNGVDGVLQELIRQDLPALGKWRPLVLREPHLPFLLDRLVVAMEACCYEESGMPPPILAHQDGELVALLPEGLDDGFFERCLTRLQSELPFSLDIRLNNKKGLGIIGGRPSWKNLVAFIREQGIAGEMGVVKKLVEVHKDFGTTSAFAAMRQPWSSVGLGHIIGAPNPAMLGKYTSLVPLSQMEALMVDAPNSESTWSRVFSPMLALLAALLAEPAKDKASFTSTQRSNALIQFLDRQGWSLPPYLANKAPDAFTNAVRLVFWATPTAMAAGRENDLWDFGRTIMSGYSDGAPMETEGHQRGLTDLFPQEWQDEAFADLSLRWSAMVSGLPLPSSIEDEGPRCLFLDSPMAKSSATLSSEFGLYEVRASAFSGRSGRPDNLMSAPASPCNFVSPIVRLEHALRKQDFAVLRQPSNGVAITVSTPLRSGLFAGIRVLFDEVSAFERKPRDVSTFELLSEDINKRTVAASELTFEHVFPTGGYRLSRYESMPTRLEDRLDFFRRWTIVARRFGRPVHMFRGVPRPTKAFLSIDSLSSELESWLGGRQWRLEQLPGVIDRLTLAQWCLDKGAGGPGMTWLHRLLDPATQWIVAAWLLQRDAQAEADSPRMNHRSRSILETLLAHHLETSMQTTPMSAPFMNQMADLNAQFQHIPGAFHRLSNNEQALAWNLAREALERHRDNHLDQAISASSIIAGHLAASLGRKDKLIRSAAASQALEQFAEIFSNQAPGLLKNPGMRQAITGAYVYLFERAVAERRRLRNEEASSSSAS